MRFATSSYKLPEQDFKLRWDLYSWPKKITDECVELEEKCIRLENKQQIEMEEARISVWKSACARRHRCRWAIVCGAHAPSMASTRRDADGVETPAAREPGATASESVTLASESQGIAGPAEFAETLKYYQSEVDALSQFHDLKLVDSIALKVATIKQNLAQADDDARLYNARESRIWQTRHGLFTTQGHPEEVRALRQHVGECRFVAEAA